MVVVVVCPTASPAPPGIQLREMRPGLPAWDNSWALWRLPHLASGSPHPLLPVPVRPSEARSRGDWEGLGNGVLVKMHGHPGLTLGSSLPDSQRGALRSHCVATGRAPQPLQ